MAQFPLSDLLTGAKRIFTTIMAKKDDGTYQEMNISNNGGIKTSLVDPLPVGSNNIGQVNIGTMPEVKITNNDEGNAILVNMAGGAAVAFTFQNAAPAASTGNVLTVGGYKYVTIETSGSSTAQTIVFEGAGSSGAYYPIQGTKLGDGTSAAQTTMKGELWRVRIEGLVSFRTNVTVLNGGTLTVKGIATA